MTFLRASGLAALAGRLDSRAEWAWGGLADHVLFPSGFASVIISNFPGIFNEFRGKPFSLLWRGGQTVSVRRLSQPRQWPAKDSERHFVHGLEYIQPFHSARVGLAGMAGNDDRIFKADDGLKSFLFTLDNPQGVPARRFALQARWKGQAVYCHAERGPHFDGIGVYKDCNVNNTHCFWAFEPYYPDDTGTQS
jgi:hypothetical protein